MSRKAKGSGFKMRSGNSVPFKQMGSTKSSTYNQTWVNPQGVTMYRHPGGLSSSTKYNPSKEGVVARKIGGRKYDYMGQPIDRTPGELNRFINRMQDATRREQKYTRWKKRNEDLDKSAALGSFWDQYQPSGSGEDFSQGPMWTDKKWDF